MEENKIRTFILPLLNVYPIFGKNIHVSNQIHFLTSLINLDAVILIQNIKRNPSNAASLKMEHFSNIEVTEVFLEATPTTFVTTRLLISSLPPGVKLSIVWQIFPNPYRKIRTLLSHLLDGRRTILAYLETWLRLYLFWK